MTEDHTTERRAAIALLKAGAVHPSEVAELASVDRQLVRYWMQAAGIDWRKIRAARLATMWSRQIKRSS